MADTPTPERLLTVADVAHRLNVPVSWVYAAAEKGTLPSLKLGHYRRFEAVAIDAWLVEQRAIVRSSVDGGRNSVNRKGLYSPVGVRTQRPTSPRRLTNGPREVSLDAEPRHDDGPHAH